MCGNGNERKLLRLKSPKYVSLSVVNDPERPSYRPRAARWCRRSGREILPGSPEAANRYLKKREKGTLMLLYKNQAFKLYSLNIT